MVSLVVPVRARSSSSRLAALALVACGVAIVGCSAAPRTAGPTGGGPDLGPAAATCGNSTCDPGEDCQTCAMDCGRCTPCSYTPTCDDAAGAPASPTPRNDLSIGAGHSGSAPMAGTGADKCDAAQLRLRVVKLHVTSGGAVGYCVVSATDGQTSEVALTTKSGQLGNGADYYFDPSVGYFWGQKGLKPIAGDLKIAYECFAETSGDAWTAALMAAGSTAQMNAGVAGNYGWAFMLGGAAANVVASILQATMGDGPRIDATQTIGQSDDLLDLTNGRDWTIQQSANGWDWTLTVEAWGCANGLP